MIKRLLQKQIEDLLFKGKIIIVYGPRQVGKTTLAKEILKKYKSGGKYINCDVLSNRQALETTEPERLKTFLGDRKIIVLDEAQRITDIGLTLKVLVDTFPKLQIIATGSSSFDLADKISEPLTGRSFKFMLYPLSLQEIGDSFDLELLLRFGSYPEIFKTQDEEMKKRLLEGVTSDYLYKDILAFERIKKSNLVSGLLQLLALQVGNEVSYRELGRTLGVASRTVEKYIDLLEKVFVVFRLRSFSRNLRKEIAKSFKVYFYDLGVRNALVQAFNPLNIRGDVGFLWENFCISERMRFNTYSNNRVNYYFWRTYDQKEIDYLEEKEGRLSGFEFKWAEKGVFKKPKDFLKAYPGSSVKLIDRENYQGFLTTS